MTTPEEFCKERGFNGKGSDMTENCLMWAMMRQYAEYYSKYLASDGELADVSDRRELIDFMNFLFDNWQPRKHLTAEMLVDGYIKSISR